MQCVWMIEWLLKSISCIHNSWLFNYKKIRNFSSFSPEKKENNRNEKSRRIFFFVYTPNCIYILISEMKERKMPKLFTST